MPVASRRPKPTPWLVLVEIGYVAGLLPVALALLAGVVVFQWSYPAAAETARYLARRCGADAPSGYRRGEPLPQWLAARMATAPFWRQDLPLLVSSMLLGLASSLSLLLFLLGAVCLFVPLRAARGEFELHVGGAVLDSPAHLWWATPLGLLGCVATPVLLHRIGALRLRVVSLLSRDEDAERAERLGQEVGDLRQGRATLVDAFDLERARIERDLHDGAQQRLTALTLTVGAARLTADALPGSAEQQRLLEQLEQVQQQAETALAELRATVRAVRPVVLADRGLIAGVRELCAASGIAVTLRPVGEDGQLTSPVASAVYFAISEALTNVARHSGVDAAEVSLTCGADGVTATVRDAGRGGARPDPAKATGIAGLTQRLAAVGGALSVDSPEGEGTTVTITAPATPQW